ncbi:MAG: hypothetical protein HY815_32630 [Candidatus Riflebacteria bacterium]|nr:hypothetical protein [Candidatus Riflebacteria bacterium]
MSATSATPELTALWRERPGPVLEGGRARRHHILGALSDRVRVHRLPLPAGPGAIDRLQAFAGALLEGLRVAATVRTGALLLFYPDLPCFVPARAVKVPLMILWVVAVRLLLTARGRRLVVDVGDVPRWQALSLNYDLPAPWWLLRMAELVVFRCADRVTVASRGMARDLALDLSLPEARLAVLPNGAPRRLLELGPPVRPAPGPSIRCIYVGSLDPAQDRGVRALCRAFLARDDPRCELVLIGENGGWIDEEFCSDRIRAFGPIPEDDCVPWIRSSHFALIPYPVDRYYRIVYPTKLALYALSRVPILSSRLPEVVDPIERHRLGECLEPDRVFGRIDELVARYRDFAGGVDLEALTWEAAVTVL